MLNIEIDGEEIELPARWSICDECGGEGKSSAYLGAFTMEQLHEDPEFAEQYMEGGYDKPCERCKGSGKVLLVDEEACRADPALRGPLRAYLDTQRAEAEYRRESEAERRAGA